MLTTILGYPANLDRDRCLHVYCDRAQLAHAKNHLDKIFDSAERLGADSVAIRVGGRVLLGPVTVKEWRELLDSQRDARR